MEAAAALERLGGWGSARQVVALSSRRTLVAALRSGEIHKVGRGRYVLAHVERDRRAAAALTGVVSHLSAAQHWGWKVKWPPDRPWVTVRRKRHLTARVRDTVHVAYADLEPEDLRDGVTSPLRTVMDCARRLPFDEALTIALRSGRAMSSRTSSVRRRAGSVGEVPRRAVGLPPRRRRSRPIRSSPCCARWPWSSPS